MMIFFLLYCSNNFTVGFYPMSTQDSIIELYIFFMTKIIPHILLVVEKLGGQAIEHFQPVVPVPALAAHLSCALSTCSLKTSSYCNGKALVMLLLSLAQNSRIFILFLCKLWHFTRTHSMADQCWAPGCILGTPAALYLW